jgi:hypothetical protein
VEAPAAGLQQAPGVVAGVSSSIDGEPERNPKRSRDARVVSIDDVCAAVASAKTAMQTTPQPAAETSHGSIAAVPAGVLETQAKVAPAP